MFEVAVFSLPVAVPTHVNRGAKQAVVGVEIADRVALGGGNELWEQCAPNVVHVGGDRNPVSGIDALAPCRWHQNNLPAAAGTGSSRSSRNRLRFRPPA